MKLYKMYFSPTGGTKKVIDKVSSCWNCEKPEIDLSNMEYTLSHIVFQQNDICIVAVPSFSGRVPQFIIPRLKQINGNGTKVILIATFGNRAFDDTLIELKDTLQEAGFSCICAMAVVTQHSVMPRYGKGRPDVADFKVLEEFAKTCKDVIENVEEEVEVPGNRPYREYITIPIKPKADYRCNGCGLCMKKCPVGAISATKIKNVDSKKCISCLQCVAVCPRNARHISGFMQMIAEIKLKRVCEERKRNELFLPGGI